MGTTKGLVSCAGSKGYLAKQILEHIPTGVPVYSPFMGGGAVEYSLAQRGQPVFGFDIFQDMVNLHQQFIGNKEALIREFLVYAPIDTKTKWNSLRAKYNQERNPFFRAAYFFLIWKTSRNPTPYGMSFGGRVGRKNGANRKGITRLYNHPVENITVRLQSYRKTLGSIPPRAAVYLDPPYPRVGGNYYKGHVGFDHHHLSRCLRRMENPWILSYPNVPELIQELYPGRLVVPLEKVNGSLGNTPNSPGRWGEVLIIGNMRVWR